MLDQITTDPEVLAQIRENEGLMGRRPASPDPLERPLSLLNLAPELRAKIFEECLEHSNISPLPIQDLGEDTGWPLRPDFPPFPTILYPICRMIRAHTEFQRAFLTNKGRNPVQEEGALRARYWNPQRVNNILTWQFDVPVRDGTSVQFFFFPHGDFHSFYPSHRMNCKAYFRHVEFRYRCGNSREIILTFNDGTRPMNFDRIISKEGFRFIANLAHAFAVLEELWDGGERAPIPLQSLCKAALGVSAIAVGALLHPEGGSKEGQNYTNKYRSKERKTKRFRNGEEGT